MSQPSKRRFPKSRAKTAYGLLTEIENIITAEPKRLAMHVVLLRGDAIPYRLYGGRLLEVPTCGTVGCIAGWVSFLRTKTDDNTMNLVHYYPVQNMLGLTESQAYELFTPKSLIRYKDAPPQTPTHAALTVEHIRRFKAKYSRQLRAHRLPPLPAGR